MSDRDLKKKSQRLSWLLRHGANESGLAMDAAGFAPVDAVLKLARLTRAELDVVIAENNKSRYELSKDGLRVRAAQGHSLSGTPVTLDGLEASWVVVTSSHEVFHGTHVDAARSILSSPDGIHPGERTHVHLADAADAKVGKRANVDVLLVISPPLIGAPLYRAPNGVLLTRAVPTKAIVDVVAQNGPGAHAEAELKAKLRVTLSAPSAPSALSALRARASTD